MARDDKRFQKGRDLAETSRDGEWTTDDRIRDGNENGYKNSGLPWVDIAIGICRLRPFFSPVPFPAKKHERKDEDEDGQPRDARNMFKCRPVRNQCGSANQRQYSGVNLCIQSASAEDADEREEADDLSRSRFVQRTDETSAGEDHSGAEEETACNIDKRGESEEGGRIRGNDPRLTEQEEKQRREHDQEEERSHPQEIIEKKDVTKNARDAEVGPVHDNAKYHARYKEICSNKQAGGVRLIPPSGRYSLFGFYINTVFVK